MSETDNDDLSHHPIPRVSERCKSISAPGDRINLVFMCKTVCAVDSDLTLQSSDGVLYKVHRKNLEFHSETFAAADAISATSDNSGDAEIVHLSERSTVLDLLLQYMYQRQPDLEKVDFQILAELAEAAEKYEVYSVMTVCNIHMRYAQPAFTFP